MSKESSTQAETTYDPHDKDPHRRKVHISKPNELFVRKKPEPKRLGAIKAGKHLTVFSVKKRRKGIRNQVTIGEFVYKRSKARLGSPLYGKWYKLHKGETITEAIKNRRLDTILVDSPESNSLTV